MVVTILGHEELKLHRWEHGLINYIDIKAKCSHLKKLTCTGTYFAAGVYLSEAPSSPRFFAVGGLAIL
jgi:hypothetical protein